MAKLEKISKIAKGLANDDLKAQLNKLTWVELVVVGLYNKNVCMSGSIK